MYFTNAVQAPASLCRAFTLFRGETVGQPLSLPTGIATQTADEPGTNNYKTSISLSHNLHCAR